MLSRIYLIRHGKTDGNRNHWYYGATDLPLNEDGLEEIRQCGRLLKKIYAGETTVPVEKAEILRKVAAAFGRLHDHQAD